MAIPIRPAVIINIIEFGEEQEEEGENSPPIAQDDSLTTDQDLELLILDPAEGILVNDWDPDGDSIAAVVVSEVVTDRVEESPSMQMEP